MRRRSRLRRLRRSIRGRFRRLRHRVHRLWIGMMWLGVGLVGLSIIVIAASIVAPGLVGISSGESPLVTSLDTDRPDPTAVEGRIAERINQQRERRGLAPLSRSPNLHDMATYHVDDQVRVGEYYAHESPSGEGVADRRERFAPECSAAGEVANHGMLDSSMPFAEADGGADTYTESGMARYAVTEWMNSQAHQRILLDSEMTRMGVGIAIADDGEFYATVVVC